MTTSQPTESENRNPLRPIAVRVGTIVGVLSAVATSLTGYGVINSVQGDAAVGLLGAIPGVITLAGTLFAAFHTARQGEDKVTPVADPRADDGTRLVPARPGTLPFAP